MEEIVCTGQRRRSYMGTMYFLLNFAMTLGPILELLFLKWYLKGRNFLIFKNNIKERKQKL